MTILRIRIHVLIFFPRHGKSRLNLVESLWLSRLTLHSCSRLGCERDIISRKPQYVSLLLLFYLVSRSQLILRGGLVNSSEWRLMRTNRSIGNTYPPVKRPLNVRTKDLLSITARLLTGMIIRMWSGGTSIQRQNRQLFRDWSLFTTKRLIPMLTEFWRPSSCVRTQI